METIPSIANYFHVTIDELFGCDGKREEKITQIMASMYRRKNKYCVVFRYTDERGKEQQKWGTFYTNSAARKRKSEMNINSKTELSWYVKQNP